MTDTLGPTARVAPDLSQARLDRRRRAERRFRWYGLFAVVAALAMLGVLLASIVGKGYSAFVTTRIALDVTFDAGLIDPQGTRDPDAIRGANYRTVLTRTLQTVFPDATSRTDRRNLLRLVSTSVALDLRDMVLADPALIGTTQRIWVAAASDIDSLAKGHIVRDVPEDDRRVNDKQIGWFDALNDSGQIARRFNTAFFTNADSREPEQAGILGAVVGTALTLAVTLVLSFPLGVMAAIYLEEIAPKNRWTDLIEININNLAAVPSIVFGLFGLMLLLNFLHLPRSAPLVGGIVLALMTLPTIIIAARAALQSVPPSIAEAALAMGASPLQVVFHHLVPVAMPGIMTGAIIGMARALGETAPLLMIGMVAFIVDVPGGFSDPATVLPVQVFLWADAPERGFVEKTSAAILVLLAFLLLMNLAAVLLRHKFERRW